MTVTNHGFIAVDNLTFDLPDPTGFLITPQTAYLDSLAAMSSVVIPVTIQRLLPGATAPINSGGPTGAATTGFS